MLGIAIHVKQMKNNTTSASNKSVDLLKSLLC